MVQSLLATAILVGISVPGMLLLKVMDKKISFAAGYVGSTVANLAVFYHCVASMAEKMEAPGTMPIKVIMLVSFIELMAVMLTYVVGCIYNRRWMSPNQLLGVSFANVRKKILKEHGFHVWMMLAATVLWLGGATYYLRYVPLDALTMMADVNRMDFFGVTNGDAMVMLGYYMKKLLSVSQADAICVVVPLGLYPAFVAVMWEVAGALTQEKRAFCFLTEAILVLLGDCFYSVPYLALHGLNRMENQMILLVLPLVFAVGLRLYFADEPIWNGENKKISGLGYILLLTICVLATKCVDLKVYALTGISVIIFVLLFVGRRYLPWLKYSKV